MNFIGSVKKALSQNGKIYFTGLVLLLGIKFYYTKAGSDELLWILAPTARWVYMLSGITFEYVSPIGYVNHSFQFILAPSCSGVRFLVICAAMLLFSFTHWMKTDKSRFCWLGAAFCLSYVLQSLSTDSGSSSPSVCPFFCTKPA